MRKVTAARDSAVYLAAKAYVDQQLGVMKKYGSAPHLSDKKYDDLIQEIVRVSTKTFMRSMHSMGTNSMELRKR